MQPPPSHSNDSGDELIVWVALIAPVLGGLAQVFIPIRKYAIATTVASIAVAIVMLAFDARDRRQHAGKWAVGAATLFPIAFPLYMHLRTRWGGPWRLPHAIVAIVILVTGFFLHGRLWGPPAVVTVSCRPNGEQPLAGYTCTPSHISGYKDARACWDLVVVCDNGTALSEHACAQVVLGAVRDAPVPYQYTPGVDECQKTAERIDNLRVEVDP